MNQGSESFEPGETESPPEFLAAGVTALEGRFSGSTGRSPNWNVTSQLISWSIVLTCTGLIAAMFLLNERIEKSGDRRPSMAEVDILVQLALGSEYLQKGQAGQFLESLDSGPIHRRLARIVLLAELAEDTESGFRVMMDLKSLPAAMEAADYQPTKTEQELLPAVQRVIQAKLVGRPVSSGDEDLRLLIRELSFAGRLAAAWSSGDGSSDDVSSGKGTKAMRQRSAIKAVFAGGLILVVLAALGVGVPVLGILVWFAYSGAIRSQLSAGWGFGYLHLEAFAVWMICFVGLQLGVSVAMEFARHGGEPAAGSGSSLWLSLLLFYLPCVIALVWLAIRHPAPRQAMREVGFTSNSVLVDLGKGAATHLAFLPILGAAIAMTALMTMYFHGAETAAQPFAPPKGPSHPIQDQFTGVWSQTLMLYLLAVVSAPLIEETVFRGFLYRYLREWTWGQRLWISIMFATVGNSLIFAAIHPQGLLGIPPLMALAAAMSVAREWSGGLIAPMLIHAVNNGTVITLMAVMFS